MLKNKNKKEIHIKGSETDIEKSEAENPVINSDVDAENNKLVELEKQVQEIKDNFLRKAAEFENYKRRTEAEISNVYKYANEGLIEELLPVLEDFERMIKSWKDTDDTESIKKGTALIYEKFRAILFKQGLKEINSVGKAFNVDLHDALMQKEDDSLPAETVVDEIEKGYYLKDKVLKHSKVVVSKKSDNEA